MSSDDEADLRRDDDVGAETSDGQGDAPGESRRVDAAADSVLDIEQALETLPEGSRLRGQAVDVDRIAASAVPDDFPHDIAGADALALTLEIDHTDGETATTYFGWPEAEDDDRLRRLLAVRNLGLDRFAELHGEQILLAVEGGHVVPVLPSEEPRGDSRAYAGVLAGLLPSLLIFLGGLLNAGGVLFTQTFVLVWLVATFLLLPVSVYLDAWHLRTTTDWEGGPLFWAALCVIPGLNVMAVAAYLLLRQSAEPLA